MKGHVKLVPDVWGYIRENKLAYPKGLYWEFKCDESPRHARSYSKGGQNTKEFTRMKDLSEWLIRMADHHEISDFRSRTWESDMYHPCEGGSVEPGAPGAPGAPE